MLERDAVLLLEDDLACGQIDALEEATDSHLAGERAESGRPGAGRVENDGGNPAAW